MEHDLSYINTFSLQQFLMLDQAGIECVVVIPIYIDIGTSRY
jgi:hypothetical protein